MELMYAVEGGDFESVGQCRDDIHPAMAIRLVVRHLDTEGECPNLQDESFWGWRLENDNDIIFGDLQAGIKIIHRGNDVQVVIKTK